MNCVYHFLLVDLIVYSVSQCPTDSILHGKHFGHKFLHITGRFVRAPHRTVRVANGPVVMYRIVIRLVGEFKLYQISILGLSLRCDVVIYWRP